MADERSRSEERRGPRYLVVGVAVFALVLIAASVAWPWLPSLETNERMSTTGRSQQIQGTSSAGKQNPPPKASDATNPETVGHAEDIAHIASQDLKLSSDQRKAVSDFVEQNKGRSIKPNFTMSVGAAVPKQIELMDLPTSVADKLTGYNGDQCFVTPNQLVIVERDTRRIVAIMPTT